MYKDKIIDDMPKLVRKDPITNELAKVAGKSADDTKNDAVDQYKNLYFTDTATWGLDSFEKELGVVTDLNKSYDSRRSFIEAKWRGSGKLTLDVIDKVCDAWKNADVKVELDDGKIKIKFVDTGGIPKDLDDLKLQIEDIKPAHIPVVWLFSYLTWDILETIFPTWNTLEGRNLTWDDLETTVS